MGGRPRRARPGASTGWAAYVAGVLWALREAGPTCPASILVDSTCRSAPGCRAPRRWSARSRWRSPPARPRRRPRRAAAGRGLRPRRDRGRRRAHRRAWTRPSRCSPSRARAAHRLRRRRPRDRSRSPWPRPGSRCWSSTPGSAHALADGGYAERRADCEAAAARSGCRLAAAGRRWPTVEALTDERVRRRARHVVTEIARVTEAVDALDARRLGRGRPADRRLARVACATTSRSPAPSSTSPSTTALEAGALGARMTGGGFGGSAIALVPPRAVDAVRAGRRRGVRGRRLPGARAPVAEPSAAAGLVGLR